MHHYLIAYMLDGTQGPANFVADINSEEESVTAGVDSSRKLYLKIFDDFPALIWRSGTEMKRSYFNHTWLDFTGRSMEEELGDGWTQGVHPDDLEACFTTYVECFARRGTCSMFYRLRNRRGEYRWIKDIGRPFLGLHDEFLGYIGSCYDVTEERESERKLEELNRNKDKFFYLVAHDLKGPVGAIESLSGMLAQDHRRWSEADRDKALVELHAAAKNVEQLLVALLDWSHGQLLGTVCEPENLGLSLLVEEASKPLRESMRAKGISFSVALDGGLTAWADPHMAQAIVRNLLSNAVKYSQPGGRVMVDAEAEEARTLLRVRDEGIGMSAAELGGLFRPRDRALAIGHDGRARNGPRSCTLQGFRRTERRLGLGRKPGGRGQRLHGDAAALSAGLKDCQGVPRKEDACNRHCRRDLSTNLRLRPKSRRGASNRSPRAPDSRGGWWRIRRYRSSA